MAETDLKEYIIDIAVNMARLMSRIVNKEIDKVVKKEGNDVITKEFEPYLYAAILLAFSRKKVDESSVAKSLVTANMSADNGYLLKLSASLNLGEKLAYGPATYFLRGVNVEPDADRLCGVVSALGIKPDKEFASEIITLYKEMESKEEQHSTIPGGFDMLIIPLFEALGKMTSEEVKRLYEIEGFADLIKEGFMSYLLAAGIAYYTGWTIKLSGKEKNRQMIKEMVEAANISPEDKMLDYLINALNLDETPPLVYLVAFYFLKALSIEPDMDKVTDVVRTIGIDPDLSIVGYILTILT